MTAGAAGQATSQHVADRGRYAGHQGAIERRALRREQPGDLPGEKRVARGAVVHGPDQRRRRLLTAHHLEQLADLARRQPCELHQLGLPGQLAQQRTGRMIADRDLHVPVRPDDEHRRVAQWRARNTSSRSDDTSAQWRSSTTTTTGRCAARLRKYVAARS